MRRQPSSPTPRPTRSCATTASSEAAAPRRSHGTHAATHARHERASRARLKRYGSGMDVHGPPGTQATPPPGPASAHGPPGTPAETWPLEPAWAPGPPGTSAPAPSGPAEGVHGVPSALKHGGGGGGAGSERAAGASAIAVAAAPANSMGVIFVSFAIMNVG